MMTTIARKIAIATQWPWPMPARSTMSSLTKIENGGMPASDSAASMRSVAPIGATREQAPDDPHVARAVAGDGRAGGEEREGLGDAVVDHVQQRTVGPDGAAEAEAERHDPDVLDAVVAEQALEVVLDQDERRRHDDRDEAEDEQHLCRERRAARGGGDRLEPDDAEQRALDEDAREQRRDRRGRLAMGVRQPQVHGRETRLGAVADHHEDEADPDDARVEGGSDLHDRRPVHRARARP